MKKTKLLAVPLLGLVWSAHADTDADRAEIERLLHEYYLTGIYTLQRADLVREAFHPDFRLAVADGSEVVYVPLEDWIDYEGLNLAETDKSEAQRAKRDASLKIQSVDIVADVAAAKAEVRIGGELTYTNFYGLAKTAGRWQVVVKHFAFHGSH